MSLYVFSPLCLGQKLMNPTMSSNTDTTPDSSIIIAIATSAAKTDDIDNTTFPEAHVFARITSVFLTQYILIIVGVLIGHLRLLSKAQTDGLGRFVHRCAVSAIIFMTTTILHLESIQWPAIWSILLSRLLLFIASLVVCLAVSRGRLLGLSAIVGLLLTDSNDIAVMYPTFRILYPTMANQCCLVVVLQLLILRPLAFLLLELNTVQERRIVQRTVVHPPSTGLTPRTLFKIVYKILLDPQFIAFCLGLICNAVFRKRPPIYFVHFFDTFGDTFVSCALIYLGLVCVHSGVGVSMEGRRLLLAVILSTKVLLVPVLAQRLYTLLQSRLDDVHVRNFVLLYSLSPANARLLPIACRYATAPHLVGDTIRIGTFLLLPCLFVYECILNLLSASSTVYPQFLEKTAVFVSWTSFLSGVWTRVVLLIDRKTVLMPHRFVVCYLDCTLVTTAIVVLGACFKSWIFDPAARITLADYIKFSFYLSADYCTRLWVAFICIGMLIQRREGRQMPRRNRTVFYIFGLLTPIILTVSMKIVSHDIRHLDVNPFYRYGSVQQRFTLAVFIICFFASVICLFMLPFHRHQDPTSCCNTNSYRSVFLNLNLSKKKRIGYAPLANRDKAHDASSEPTTNHTAAETISLVNHVEEVENELVKRDGIDDQSEFQAEKPTFTEDPNNTDGQLCRHFALVGLNLVGMIFGAFGCMWRLLRLQMTKTVIALEFIDQVFNFGQGFLVFSLYGSNVECISQPLLRICSKIRECVTLWALGIKRQRRRDNVGETEGENKVTVPHPTRLTSTWRIAESFALRHLTACRDEICKPISLPTRQVEWAFVFVDFREWLLKRHLCYNLQDVLSLLLALELNDYVRGLSVTSVYALDPESCDQCVFEFISLD